MDYKIIAANAAIGQIQVTYSNAGSDVATYAIDVPVVGGAFITGAELDAEIQRRAPTWLVERQAEVSAATGFDAIHSLVQAPVAPTPVLSPVAFTISEVTA